MKRILIADDEFNIADGVRQSLDSQYRVDIATNGSQVLKKYKNSLKSCDYYQAVILDINFEYGISGLEVAERIRQKDIKIPILIFSAFEYSDNVIDEVKKVGAKFFKKPLTIEDIRKFIECENKGSSY